MIQALKLSMSWGYETFTWFVYFWKQQFSVCRIFMCTEKGEQLTPHLKSLFSLVFAKSIWGVGKGREYEGSLQGESSYYTKAFIVSPAQLEFVSVQTRGCSSHIPKDTMPDLSLCAWYWVKFVGEPPPLHSPLLFMWPLWALHVCK